MDDNNNTNYTIIEAREALMVSPSSGQNQTLRTAYFVTPPSIKDSQVPPPHFTISSQTTTNLPLEVRYNGWRNPHAEWKNWVKKLQPKFESLWLKTGIYHAIKASEYEIKRDDDLILELANRWCSKTNTFVFPWGETTLTLEDTKVCFGFSVLGCSVSTPIMNSEQEEAEEELFEARRMFNSSRAKKVCQSAWMKHFMNNESKVEHEAFLVYWLSRFVFPADSFDTISKSVFPIAIHLAYGTRIALAPAVLASVYRDLSLLNSIIKNNATITMKSLRVTIWAPFQLVQIWALERFLALKLHPCEIRNGLSNVARWGGERMMKNKNLKMDLDCAGFRDGFLWKPYENSPCIEVYNEKDMWKCDNPCLDEELSSFSRYLMVCELVGIGCKEKYFPHRVAMQFGMDQDIPGEVDVCKNDPWMSDSEPVALVYIDLCIQLCFRQPDVTSRYYDWWKQSKSSPRGDNSTIKVEQSYDLPPPPGFTSKFGINQMEGSDKEGHAVVYELSSSDDVVVADGKGLSSAEFGDFTSSFVGDEAEMNSLFCDRNGENEESFSPFTLDMANDLENRIEKLERVADKVKKARFDHKVGKVHESKNLLNQCSSTSSADSEKILPLKRPVSKDNTELSKGVLEDELKDANESKKARMCSGRVCLSETQGEGKNYAIRNKVSLSTHEIAGYGDEAGIKSPSCDRNGEKGKSVSPFTSDRITDLENRIQKLERVIAKLKEARFGSKG